MARRGRWGKRRSGSFTGAEAGATKRLRSPLFPTLEQKLLSKPPDLMPHGRDRDLMNRYRKYREEIQMSPFYMSTEEQVNVRYSDQQRQVPNDRPLPIWLPQFKPERFLPQRLCRWLNVSTLTNKIILNGKSCAHVCTCVCVVIYACLCNCACCVKA